MEIALLVAIVSISAASFGALIVLMTRSASKSHAEATPVSDAKICAILDGAPSRARSALRHVGRRTDPAFQRAAIGGDAGARGARGGVEADIGQLRGHSDQTTGRHQRGHEGPERILGQAQSEGRQAQRESGQDMLLQLRALTEAHEKKQEELREIIRKSLEQLRTENEAKLEQMRATVEEKLQGTLDQRLGDSFKIVSERLEQVHRGLGEMQTLATGVGDLKRVLSNVKSRGGWGEVQLGMLLEDMLTPDQYGKNVRIRPDSGEMVEFAVRLPGSGDGATIHLPIDAKFPHEDYERLTRAQEAGAVDECESALAALERAVRLQARTICEKYIHPPHSTDSRSCICPPKGCSRR